MLGGALSCSGLCHGCLAPWRYTDMSPEDVTDCQGVAAFLPIPTVYDGSEVLVFVSYIPLLRPGMTVVNIQ